MTEHDFELLSQYLDGELGDAEAAALEQRLANEPGLRSTLDSMRRVDDDLRAALHPPGCDRVPRHVAALLEEAGAKSNVVPFPSRRGRAGVGLAVAASLLAAVGLWLAPQWQVAERGAHPADAANDLVAQALENTPSSADEWTPLDDGGQLRAVLSFAGASGQWCREYQLGRGTEQWRGVACRSRDSGAWHTQVLVEEHSAAAATGADYQPAGAGDLDTISNYIGEHATDIPLSASEESELIANDWQ
ncbi:hypothetical protein [Parahaliea mediterranea]|uniref:Anti-sigma factor n=1 Tax=Parahaliea mediterranea TaxID=651086 RepID=A0A939DDA8_9GAMM|nr:hypothetical protein [Parahaliea mediterranea]MBN7795970.1 hypothetical protein [Parahaliea mediterranea]